MLLSKTQKKDFIEKYTIEYNKSWKNTFVYQFCKLFKLKKKPSYNWLVQHKRILNRKNKSKSKSKYIDLTDKLI